MSRRRFTAFDASADGIVGWDPGLGTYFATIGPESDSGEPAVWVGTFPAELQTVDSLAAAIATHADLPPLLRSVLEFDRDHGIEESGGGPWEADWELREQPWTSPWEARGLPMPASLAHVGSRVAVPEDRDHFVRVDGGEPLIFGVMQPLEHALAGADPADIAEERRLYEAGLRWSRCFSTHCPQGEGGYVHVASMRLISAEEFETARSCGWTLPA